MSSVRCINHQTLAIMFSEASKISRDLAMQLLCQDGQDLYLAMDATERTSERVEARQGARELRLPGQSLTRSLPRWHLPGIQPKFNSSTPKCCFLGLLPKIRKTHWRSFYHWSTVVETLQRPRNCQALFSILITRDKTRCAVEVLGVSKRIRKMYANLSGHQTILVEIWPQLRLSANLGSKLTKIFSWTMPQGERIWKIWKGLIWRFVLLISMHGSLARVNTTRRHKASRKTRNQRPITLTRGWICFLKHPSVNKFERLCCEHRCRHAAQLSRQKSRCFTTALATAHHLPQLPLDTMLLVFWSHTVTLHPCWFDAIHLRPTLSWALRHSYYPQAENILAHISALHLSTLLQSVNPDIPNSKLSATPLWLWRKNAPWPAFLSLHRLDHLINPKMDFLTSENELIRIAGQSAVKAKNMKNMKWIPKGFSMLVFTKAPFK